MIQFRFFLQKNNSWHENTSNYKILCYLKDWDVQNLQNHPHLTTFKLELVY